MEKMRFEEFTEAVVSKIREYLPESFANASVELRTVTKNNDMKLTGLTIRNAESNLSPTIYLEKFFESYQTGTEMGQVLEDIADARIKTEFKDTFDINSIISFDKAKEKIVPRLVGLKYNKDLLRARPFKVIADLAVTYHVLVSESESGVVSAPITNEMMNAWETDLETLHEISIRNLPKLLPSLFQPMSTVLLSMMSKAHFNEGSEDLVSKMMTPAEEIMFVLSNQQKTYGATALLDKDIMMSIVEQFGENFVILPSSIHECIIVPTTPDMDESALSDMVRSVNATAVAPDEVLSDHIYRYATKEGLLPA